MRTALSTVLIVITLVGCEASGPSNSTPAPEATGAAPPPPEPAAGQVADGSTAGAAATRQKAPPAPSPAASQAAASAPQPVATQPAAPSSGAQAAADATSEKAGVGVGAKGRDYGGPGFVTTPVETFFRAQERITFEAQIPNNMKIYKAQHDNKGPKSQEEFMRVIIQEGGVDLPELPAGDTYLYDPKTEQLMVRHREGG